MKSLSASDRVAAKRRRVSGDSRWIFLGRENTDGFQGDTEEQIQRHIDVMSHYMRRDRDAVGCGAEGLIIGAWVHTRVAINQPQSHRPSYYRVGEMAAWIVANGWTFHATSSLPLKPGQNLMAELCFTISI